MLMGLETTVHPFVSHSDWRPLEAMAPAERHARLAQDADLRRRLETERRGRAAQDWMATALERTFELGEKPNYEPYPSASIAARASAKLVTPSKLSLNQIMPHHGRCPTLKQNKKQKAPHHALGTPTEQTE